ncbi:hypothetical protein DIPPA_33777 [Diplonema papillatum]|nr:hypothetical protein DIPPA_33777 [Diplonema papillatum]
MASASQDTEIARLREEGKRRFEEGSAREALRCYDDGLRLLAGGAAPGDRLVFMANKAACLLALAEGSPDSGGDDCPAAVKCAEPAADAPAEQGGQGDGESGGREGLLYAAVCLCSEVLREDGKHLKARWRRAKANGQLGLLGLRLADLRVVHVLASAEGKATRTLAAAAQRDVTALADASADPFHRALATGDFSAVRASAHLPPPNPSPTPPRLVRPLGPGGGAPVDTRGCSSSRGVPAGGGGGSSSDDAFLRGFAGFSEKFGDGTLAYMLAAPCAGPACDALNLLEIVAAGLRASGGSEGRDATAAFLAFSSHEYIAFALDHPGGEHVKECACRVTGGVFELMLGAGAGSPMEYVRRYALAPCFAGCISSGGAATQACLQALRVVFGSCVTTGDKQAASHLAEVVATAATILWNHPSRAPSVSHLFHSLDPKFWSLLVPCLPSLPHLKAMKAALLHVTRYKDAVVSSDAATLIGIIEEILHPDDHCCMEDDVPPLSPTPQRCAQCGKAVADLDYCSFCKLTAYCSTDCQARDWERHSIYCGQRNDEEQEP